MESMLLSSDARVVLAKMSVLFERERGRRVKLSRDDDIVTIVNHAIDTISEEYKRLYQTFIALLSPTEMHQLVQRGAHIYRGAVVPDPHPADTPVSESRTQQQEQATYRGVPVAKSTKEREDVKQKEQKPLARVYRGRVIDE